MKNWLLAIGLFLLGMTCSAFKEPSSSTNTIEVHIHGLENGALTNAFQQLTDQHTLIKQDFNKTNLFKFYQSISTEIKSAIQPYGYFKPNIRTSLQQTKPNFWVATVDVNAGPRMRFNEVHLVLMGPGKFDPKFQELLNNFPVKPGDYFDTENYEYGKAKLYQSATAHGYFDAKIIDSNITVNLSTYQASITIIFDTGRRYRIGKTTFSETPFNEQFLNRYLKYHPGDYYHQRQIRLTRQGLANSNYFSSVIVIPDTDHIKNYVVPIKVELQPQARKQYTIGAGYGTDTGIRGSLGVDLRFVNQYGHYFNAYARASQINSELVANYFIPGRDPANNLYIFTGGLLDQSQNTGQGRSGRLSVGYQTFVGSWQQTLSLIYLQERSRLTDNPYINSSLVYPTITWQKLKLDNPLHPKYGYSIIGGLTGSNSYLLSNISFLQSRFNSRYLFTLFDKTRVILGATLGYTDIKTLSTLPLSLQLFAGGAQSMRGYAYNTVGPGRELLVGSIEVQQRLKGNFYLAGFFDFGNVSNDVFSQPLKEGIGPGIVWISPIGMLALTVANAISQPNHPWVIQFSMGPAL